MKCAKKHHIEIRPLFLNILVFNLVFFQTLLSAAPCLTLLLPGGPEPSMKDHFGRARSLIVSIPMALECIGKKIGVSLLCLRHQTIKS